jgi:hypothetical protein
MELPEDDTMGGKKCQILPTRRILESNTQKPTSMKSANQQHILIFTTHSHRVFAKTNNKLLILRL